MALPKNVLDSIGELDDAHDQRFAPWRNQWQIVRAQMLSHDAEIERMQSHLAMADALLRKVYDHGEDMRLHERIEAHLQGAGDE